MSADSRSAGPSVGLAGGVFALHAALRVGGMWEPVLVPLSMVVVWPLPWLLLGAEERRRIGIRRPVRRGWLGVAGLAGLAALAGCAVAAGLLRGGGPSNWLVQHRTMLEGFGATTSTRFGWATTFWMLTAPAMIVSPLGEELVYRGFLQHAFARRWNATAGLVLPSGAFALIHLAHYGLDPFDPALVTVWVPSMFCFGALLAWLTNRYRSLAPPILAHAAFNLAMNWVALRLLPALANA